MQSVRRLVPCVLLAALLWAPPASAVPADTSEAASPELTLAFADCISSWQAGVVDVDVGTQMLPVGTKVRVLFRRLTGADEPFYFVDAEPVEGSLFKAVLPPIDDESLAGTPRTEPAQWQQPAQTGEYGEMPRDWLAQRSLDEWSAWMAEQDSPPVEVVALWLEGEEVRGRTPLVLLPVSGTCDPPWHRTSRSWADAIILGVTAPHQLHEPPFGWGCRGVLARQTPFGERGPDPHCLGGEVESPWGGETAAIEAGPGETPQLPGEPEPYSTVRVFYGTDRAREFLGPDWLRERDDGDAYGGRRGVLELGVAEVSIPLEHEPGELEAPGLFERADPEKHVLLLTVTPAKREAFVADVRSVLAGLDDQSALVFVHGYNVSFEDAARRAAQMVHDLHYGGLPALYSWPSQGSLEAYAVDEANNRWTVPHLQEFFELLSAEAGVETIHVVAHSMGNRAMTEVLRRFATERRFEQPEDRPSFGKIVLAAPDVDADVFRLEIAPALAELSSSVTLYASSADQALRASKKFHGTVRAGDLSDGVVIADRLVTIDASEVDTSLLRLISLGHSYFADKVSVLSDIRQLLAGTPEEARGLQKLFSQQLPYWKLNP